MLNLKLNSMLGATLINSSYPHAHNYPNHHATMLTPPFSIWTHGKRLVHRVSAQVRQNRELCKAPMSAYPGQYDNLLNFLCAYVTIFFGSIGLQSRIIQPHWSSTSWRKLHDDCYRQNPRKNIWPICHPSAD